jgi:dTDP-glucose pyrophosphorylase
MKSWESVLIEPSLPFKTAISVLNRGGLQIAVVVDKQRGILGTVTDGDVRRALIRQVGLDAPITEVMARQPRTTPAGSTKERILHLMERHRISQILLVDADGRIVGIETLHGLLQTKRRRNAVFLMAGGFGKRLQPLTIHCPKPLLNIGNKPLLEIIIESFIAAGFYRFFISIHYQPEMIRQRIGDGSRWNVEIEYIHEEQPLGTGGSLGLLPKGFINEPMIMMNGDLLTNLNFQTLLEFHENNNGIATICVREYEHRVPYGVVRGDGSQVVSMVEKPVYKEFINAGIYVLSPAILNVVEPGRHIDMPTLLGEIIKNQNSVNMFPIHEYWLDIGRLEDFQRAQVEIGGFLNA